MKDNLNIELESVQQALNRFERTYGKTSDFFFKEYQDGAAGDEMDYIEWASLVMMRDRLLVEAKGQLISCPSL